MGYEDPCANDPAHGLATVGLNGRWVCHDCFVQALAETRDVIDLVAGTTLPPKAAEEDE